MKPQHIYVATVLAWGAVVGADAAIYFTHVLGSPSSEEVYANGVNFQLMAYALTRGSYFVFGLFCVLLVEFIILGRKHRPHEPQA